MTILELAPFDITTASPSRLVNTAGFWEALPRIARGLPSARLLMVADTLKKETILDGFQSVATPEQFLPPGVLAYRIDYEDFLRRTIQAVRYIRLYLVVDTNLEENSLIGLLGAFGVQAFPLDHELPRPFTGMAASEWTAIVADDGRHFGLLRTKYNQRTALIHPRTLHNLLAQDFPVWAVLQIHTFPQRETMRLLRQKAAATHFGGNKSLEGIQDAREAGDGVMAVREAVSRGEAMHTASLYVLVDAPDEKTLNGRVEIVRGAVTLEMEKVYAPGRVLPTLFSAETLAETDGTMMTTTGAALLAGSALSYRRRTTTKGILLGIDRNQAPVILDIFDDRNPSYNTVILGQTGSGKTFATQVLMLRHLLMGMRLIIIDPQGNVDLEFLGPDVYQRSVLGTAGASVNVLDIINTEIGSQVEMAISMLRMLGVHRDEPMERALLDEALMSLYQPIWGMEGVQAPTLVDLHAFMQNRIQGETLENVRETAGMLALSLSNYVRGSRADLFGKPTTVDFKLDHTVNVFDVSRLPQQGMGGNLRSALLSILVGNINQGIRRLRRAGDFAPILFFVDEMGILMRDAVIAEYISAEYKTARARLVGMIVADQDLHSLLGPQDEKGLHHGVPILANAANTLIFNQKDSERAAIQEHFPTLPGALVDALPVLPRGTCIAKFADDDLLVVNITPSKLDRVILSSRLQDRQLAKKIIQRMNEEITQ